MRSLKEKICNSFTVIDVGTTGLEPDSEIAYLAAVKFIDCEVTDKFSAYIKCKADIPDSIAELTGISNEFLDNNGIGLNEAISRFIEFCGRFKLVSRHVDFIKPFIDRECKIIGFEAMNNNFTDVGVLFKQATSKRMNRSNLAEFLGVSLDQNDDSPIDFDLLESQGKAYIKLQQL